MIKRRAVLVGIAGTIASGPLGAQTPARDGMRRLGVLMANSANDPVAEAYRAALTKGLRLLSWNEGGNLRIDWRCAAGTSQPIRCGTHAANQYDPDRIHDGLRPGRPGICRQPGASGWQRHRV